MIEDFGDKIDGAAKDRWKEYRQRIGDVRDDMVIHHSLGQVFPEPAYQTLEKEGVDQWSLAFVRAVRDVIPRKPRAPHRQRSWAQQVVLLRKLCTDLLDGNINRAELEEKLGDQSEKNILLMTRISMYMEIGHKNSLRNFEINAGTWQRFGGVDYNPPKFFCQIESLRPPISVSGETAEEAVRNLKEQIKDKEFAPTKTRSASKFEVYTNNRTKVHFIGKKIGKDIIRIKEFPSLEQAFKYLREHEDDIIERFEAMKKSPEERRSSNAQRVGKDRRFGRDVTPEIFQEAFGFRGVQFGNYVEKERRQLDLNNAYDALMDLSEVLDCAPSDLSLNGTLGLAFGARGRGGKGAAAAHYEPGQIVINMTKRTGAGSLAHEWFHALDNHIGRRAGNPNYFATELKSEQVGQLTYEDRQEIGAFTTLMTELGKTSIEKRSARLDRFRSSAYYTQSLEIAARSFEAWVIAETGRQGITNDYLANVVDEALYNIEAQILGVNEERYPYPLKSEMDAVNHAFTQLFSPEGVVKRNMPGHTQPDIHRALETDHTDLGIRTPDPDTDAINGSNPGPASRPAVKEEPGKTMDGFQSGTQFEFDFEDDLEF
jgi:hypothetical protein